MIRTILAKERILNLKEKFQVIMRNFLKDIIAFSNSTGGKVIVGIEDETGTVYGIGEQSHLNCRIPFLIWFQMRVHHRLNRIFQSRQ